MTEPDEDDAFEGTRMSLGEHLDELRTRLIRGLAALAIAFLVCWFFRDGATDVVMRPMFQALAWIDADQVAKYELRLAADPELDRTAFFLSDDPADKTLRPELTVAPRPQALGFTEQFWFAVKVTGLFAFALGGPVLLWQMWQFVAAGLYRSEQRVVHSYFPVSVLLFLVGVLFGYFVLVPYGFYFLASTFDPEKIEFAPRLTDFFSLMTILTVALGVIFQLPMLMHALVRLDLVRRATFAKYRLHFIVAAFIIGAVLTPPDPFTQTLLAVPMILLFELGLFTSRLAERKAEAPEAPEATG